MDDFISLLKQSMKASVETEITMDEPDLINEDDLRRAMDYRRNSPNTKFHRTPEDEECKFEFLQQDDASSSEKISEFESLYYQSYQTAELSEQISLVCGALARFQEAKEWHYGKSRGAMLWFQDVWENMHNSHNPCFSWEDIAKERLQELIDMAGEGENATSSQRKNESMPIPSAGEVVLQQIRTNGYDFDVQESERLFFDALGESLCAAKLEPERMRLERMSNGTFNVFYEAQEAGMYVGKVYARKLPDKWAVKRPGASRATRVFDDEGSAIEYIATKQGYEIEHRVGCLSPYIQYLRGLYTVRDLCCSTIEECIAAIPYWIKYITKQIAETKKALRI